MSKVFKYLAIAVLMLVSAAFIVFYIFVVQSYKIEIHDNEEKTTYYTYNYIVSIEDEETIKILLNHQKLWSITYWIRFPEAEKYSAIYIKLNHGVFKEANGRISTNVEGSVGETIVEFHLEGDLTVDGNILRDINLHSVDAENGLEVNYYLRKIDLSKAK